MGIVYRALDPLIGRTVAIKTIRLDIPQQPAEKDEALKRFLREAQSVGNLSHPNIVTVYDVGEDNGLIYIAMEYIAGDSLEDMLKRNKKFSLDEIVQLFSQLGAALDYAHQRGIVHRDIKPANILIGPNHKVSIVDFGIARTASSTLTQTGMFLGTPRYMSPEQIAGKKVDNRSDIFSLGAILYEMLTQCNPFEGESITTVIHKIMHAKLRPLSDFNKQLPKGLDGVVKKALARDVDCRYRTCRELLEDLTQYSLSQGHAATIREGLLKTHETHGPEAPATVAPLALKNKKPLFLVLLAMIIVLGTIMTIIWFGGRKRAKPPAGGNLFVEPPGAIEAVNSGQEKSAGISAIAETDDAMAIPPPAQENKQKDAALKIPTEKPKAEPKPETVRSHRNAKGFDEQVLFNHTVMVHVPAGEFTVGSPRGQGNEDERPAHRVFISAFWLGKYEVTFKQYDFFCRESGRSRPGDEGWGRGDRPVIHVSWDDAQAYCRWLTKKTARNFRLPSEAEWEKAARAKYPWGSSEPSADKVNMNGSEDGFPFSAPVGSFPRGESHYGIMDMAGNVWEWTFDWYAGDYFQCSPARDPRGPAKGSSRVVRGGSWKNGPELIRSANRSSEKPDRRLNELGFRVAMDHR